MRLSDARGPEEETLYHVSSSKIDQLSSLGLQRINFIQEGSTYRAAEMVLFNLWTAKSDRKFSAECGQETDPRL
jgi:hypothetical protein